MGADQSWAKETQIITLGDFGFADDAGITGYEEETIEAEKIFVQTLTDWEKNGNMGKTERLRLKAGGRVMYDVRGEGEAEHIWHVGGWLSDKGGTREDTRIRCSKTRSAIVKLAKAWALGTSHGRVEHGRLLKTARSQVAKAIVIPILTTFGRSRHWTRRELDAAQRVANYAVRRCMGMDGVNMEEWKIIDKMLYKALKWDSMEDTLCRHTNWLGHVARMPIYRRPKQVIFGWIANTTATKGWGSMTISRWYVRVLQNAGVNVLDWYRKAQNRKEWRKTVQTSFPTLRLPKELQSAITD